MHWNWGVLLRFEEFQVVNFCSVISKSHKSMSKLQKFWFSGKHNQNVKNIKNLWHRLRTWRSRLDKLASQGSYPLSIGTFFLFLALRAHWHADISIQLKLPPRLNIAWRVSPAHQFTQTPVRKEQNSLSLSLWKRKLLSTRHSASRHHQPPENLPQRPSPSSQTSANLSTPAPTLPPHSPHPPPSTPTFFAHRVFLKRSEKSDIDKWGEQQR